MLANTSTGESDSASPSNVLNLYVQSVSRDREADARSARHQLSSLSVEEVSEWLGIVRCSAFAIPFAKRGFNGHDLERLTERDLLKLGIGTPAQRKKLLKYIRQASRRKVNLRTSPTREKHKHSHPRGSRHSAPSRPPLNHATPYSFREKDRAIQEKLDALLSEADKGRSVAASRVAPSRHPGDNVATRVALSAAERKNEMLQEKIDALRATMVHHPNDANDGDSHATLNRRLHASNLQNQDLRRKLRGAEAGLQTHRAGENRTRKELAKERSSKEDLQKRFADYTLDAETSALDQAVEERKSLEAQLDKLKDELTISKRENEELHRAQTHRMNLESSDDGAPKTLQVHGLSYVRGDLPADDAAAELRAMTEKAWILASKRLSESDAELAAVQSAHSKLKRQLDNKIQQGKNIAADLEAQRQKTKAANSNFQDIEHRLRVEEAKLRAANEALDDMRRQFDDVQADRIRLLGASSNSKHSADVARAVGATAKQISNLLAAKTTKLATSHQQKVALLRQQLRAAQQDKAEAARSLEDKTLRESATAKELTVLRVYIADQERIISDLKSQSDARERRVRFLEEEQKHIFDSPAAQLVQVKQLLVSEERASKNLSQKVQHLTQHIELLQDQLTKQHASGAILEQRLSERDIQAKHLRNTLHIKTLAQESAEAALAETDEKLKRTESLLEECRGNLEASRNEARQLRADVQQARSDRELALLAKDAAEKALPHAQERLKQAHERCYELETRLLTEATRKAELVEVGQRAAAAEGDNSKQRTTIHELNNTVAEMRNKLAELLQENHKLRNRVARNDNEVLGSQKEAEALSLQLQQLKGQLAAERKVKQEAIVENEHLQEELSKAHSVAGNLKSELVSVRLALEDSRKIADSTQRNLSEQNQFLQNRNNDLLKHQRKLQVSSRRPSPRRSTASRTSTRRTTTTVTSTEVDTGGIGRQTVVAVGPEPDADGSFDDKESDHFGDEPAIGFDADDLSAEIPLSAIPSAVNEEDDVTAAPEVRLQKLKLAQERRLVQDFAQSTAIEQQLQHLQDSLDIEVRSNAQLRADIAGLRATVEEQRGQVVAAETQKDDLQEKVDLLELRLEAAKRHTEDVVSDLRASLSSGLTERSEVEQLRSHETVLVSAAVTADTRARAADGVIASYQAQIEELRALASRQVERHERELQEAETLADEEREKLRVALAAATEDCAQLRTVKKNLGIAVKQLELQLDAAERQTAAAEDKRASAERAREALRDKLSSATSRDKDAQRQLMHVRADYDRRGLELESAIAQIQQLEEQLTKLRQSALQSSSEHIALIAAAEAKVTVADEEKDTLSRQRESLVDKLEETRRILMTVRTELSTVRSSEAQLQQKCARLEGALGHADALEQQHNDSMSEIAKLRSAIDQKESQLDELRNRNRDLKEELDRASSELQNVSNDRSDAEAVTKNLEAQLRREFEEKYRTVITTTTTRTEESIRSATQALEAQVLSLTKQLSQQKDLHRQADDAARRKLRQVALHLADVLRNAAAVQLVLRQEREHSHQIRQEHDLTVSKLKELQCQLDDAKAARSRLEKTFVEPLQAQLDKCTEQMNAAIRERAVVSQQLQSASTAIVSRDSKLKELQSQVDDLEKTNDSLKAAGDEVKKQLAESETAHKEELERLRKIGEQSRSELAESSASNEMALKKALRSEQAATEKALEELADAQRQMRLSQSEKAQLQQEVTMLRKYLDKLRDELADREVLAGKSQQELQSRFLATAQNVMELEAKIAGKDSELASLEQKLESQQQFVDQIPSLKAQLASVEADLEKALSSRGDPDAEAKVQELSSQLEEENHRCNELRQQVEATAGELQEFVEKSKQCKEKCAALEQQLHDATEAEAKARAILQEQQLEQENKLAMQRGDLARATAEVRQLQEDLEQVYRERRVVPTGKHGAVEEVAKNVALALEEASRFASETEQLKEQLAEARREAEDWQKATEDCEEGRGELTDSVAKTQKALEDARTDLAHKESEIDTLTTEIAKLRGKVNADDSVSSDVVQNLQLQHEEEKSNLRAMLHQLMQERDAFKSAADEAMANAEAAASAAADSDDDGPGNISALLEAGLTAGHWTGGTIKHKFDASNDEELSVAVDEMVDVRELDADEHVHDAKDAAGNEKDPNRWVLARRANGAMGLVPLAYIELDDEDEDDAEARKREKEGLPPISRRYNDLYVPDAAGGEETDGSEEDEKNDGEMDDYVQWLYVDDVGQWQGPFDANQLRQWYRDGLFDTQNLLVAPSPSYLDDRFLRHGDMDYLYDPREALLAKVDDWFPRKDRIPKFGLTVVGVQEQAAKLRLIERYVARWRLNRWSTNRDLRVATDFNPASFDPKALGMKGAMQTPLKLTSASSAPPTSLIPGKHISGPHPQRMMPVRAGEVVNVLLWSIRDGTDEYNDWVRVVRVNDESKTDGLIPRNCLANYGVIHRMNEAAVMLRATLRLQAQYRARLVQRFLIKETRPPLAISDATSLLTDGLKTGALRPHSLTTGSTDNPALNTAAAAVPAIANVDVNNAIADIGLGLLRKVLTDDASFENSFEALAGSINGKLGAKEWLKWVNTEPTMVNVVNVNRNSGADPQVVANCLEHQFGTGPALDFFQFKDYFSNVDAATDLTADLATVNGPSKGVVHTIESGDDIVHALHTFTPARSEIEEAVQNGHLPPLALSKGDALQIVDIASLSGSELQLLRGGTPFSEKAKAAYLLFGDGPTTSTAGDIVAPIVDPGWIAVRQVSDGPGARVGVVPENYVRASATTEATDAETAAYLEQAKGQEVERRLANAAKLREKRFAERTNEPSEHTASNADETGSFNDDETDDMYGSPDEKEKARQDARLKYRASLRDRNLHKMVNGSSLANTPTAAGRATMVVSIDYIRESDDELTVKAGELVQIISSSVAAGADNDDLRTHDPEEELDPGWVRVRCISDPTRVGLVPENFLALASLSAQDAETREYLLLHQGGGTLAHTPTHSSPAVKTPQSSAALPNGVLDDENSTTWDASHIHAGSSASSSREMSPLSPVRRGQEYVVLYRFEAEGGDELTVEQGQRIWAIVDDDDDDDPGWLRVVDDDDVVGIVPETYVRPV